MIRLSGFRRALVLSGLLATALPALAADPLPPRPLVDRSLVSLPEQAGRFALGRSHASQDPAEGVRANYHVAGTERGPTIIVRAIPRGRLHEERAVDEAMAAFEREFLAAPGRREAMALPRRLLSIEPVDASLYRNTPGLHTRGFHADHVGSRQSFTSVEEDGVAVRTAVLVFHRHLYDIRVRVSAPAASMPQEAFDRLADEAAAALAPALDIRNFGRCTSRPRQDNCAATETSLRNAPPATGVVHVLEFVPAGR